MLHDTNVVLLKSFPPPLLFILVIRAPGEGQEAAQKGGSRQVELHKRLLHLLGGFHCWCCCRHMGRHLLQYAADA